MISFQESIKSHSFTQRDLEQKNSILLNHSDSDQIEKKKTGDTLVKRGFIKFSLIRIEMFA